MVGTKLIPTSIHSNKCRGSATDGQLEQRRALRCLSSKCSTMRGAAPLENVPGASVLLNVISYVCVT